ncbi:MAG: MBL fold metallo-hydrolase [Promethearchaeota archaeon]
MILEVERVTFFGTNCYLFGDEDSGKVVFVDPGERPAGLVGIVAERGYEPVAVLITHGHPDHIGGARRLREEYRVPLVFHPADQDLVGRPPDVAAVEGEVVGVGKYRLEVLEAPGHSPGGVMFYEAGLRVLFSGDTLFRLGVGRTDLRGGDFDTLMRTIGTKVAGNPRIPGDAHVYPGHMGPTTKLDEVLHNPFRKYFLEWAA